MLTLHVDRLEPDHKAVRAAADAIKRGDLVILPMETSYIVAADAMNSAAVARVFTATDRDQDDALSLLVSGLDDILKAAEYLPDGARQLALKYWPGHLALIVDLSNDICSAVTGGRKTGFVMAPEHPVALALLRQLRTPLAVTNANVSGDPPPATAVEAVEGLGHHVEVVLDAGASTVGHVPTVVDVSKVPPSVVRMGTVSMDEVRAALGQVRTAVA